MNAPKLLAEFLAGCTTAKELVRVLEDKNLLGCPLYVFAGRSNVGKSSLLNGLTGTKIARVSQEPGRTREFNVFLWRGRILLDLPGYGYAQVSRSLRDQWGRELDKLFSLNLLWAQCFALVDSRHGFQKTDAQLVEFFQSQNRPYTVVFTKWDKHKSNNEKARQQKVLEREAMELGVEHFLFISVQTPGGVAGLRKWVLDGVI